MICTPLAYTTHTSNRTEEDSRKEKNVIQICIHVKRINDVTNKWPTCGFPECWVVRSLNNGMCVGARVLIIIPYVNVNVHINTQSTTIRQLELRPTETGWKKACARLRLPVAVRSEMTCTKQFGECGTRTPSESNGVQSS